MGPPHDDYVRTLVEEILRNGVTLSGLVSTLIEELPEDAFPGENTTEVLIEMVTGSVRPAVEAVGPQAAREAAALVGAVTDRVLGDLRKAAELARER
jgi:hypothetical protein